MRSFVLFRRTDETGVSGTGVVAEGARFADDTVALRWLTENTSTSVYDSIETVKSIHGHGGKTVVIFENNVTRRGVADAVQDDCENRQFASVGGPDGPKLRAEERCRVMVAPEYIAVENAEHYLAGYQWAYVTMYGVDWRTRKGEVDGGVVAATTADCAAPERE